MKQVFTKFLQNCDVTVEYEVDCVCIVPPKTKIIKIYFSQIIGALGLLSRLQMMHRDLKPENVFISELTHDHIVVKVGDFGLVACDVSTKI